MSLGRESDSRDFGTVTLAALLGTGGPPFRLPRASIDVWWARLDDLDASDAPFEAIVSAAEAERAARLYFDGDRRRFLIGRALLRLLIGQYLAIDARDIGLTTGPYGKPEVRLATGTPARPVIRPAPGPPHDLRFNASGSAGIAVYAFTIGREVGIDLEKRRAKPDAGRIAARFFSPEERQALALAPAADRPAGFFTIWSRKEAYAKARGEGLTRPFAEFTTTLSLSDPPALFADRRDPAAPGQWDLHDLDIVPGFSAALCAEGPSGPITVTGIVTHRTNGPAGWSREK